MPRSSCPKTNRGPTRNQQCLSLSLLFVFLRVLRVFRCGLGAGKKVYISVDMEGISGVVGDDQTSAGGRSTTARES